MNRPFLEVIVDVGAQTSMSAFNEKKKAGKKGIWDLDDDVVWFAAIVEDRAYLAIILRVMREGKPESVQAWLIAEEPDGEFYCNVTMAAALQGMIDETRRLRRGVLKQLICLIEGGELVVGPSRRSGRPTRYVLAGRQVRLESN
jgi:hypothetical protein